MFKIYKYPANDGSHIFYKHSFIYDYFILWIEFEDNFQNLEIFFAKKLTRVG